MLNVVNTRGDRRGDRHGDQSWRRSHHVFTT